MVNLDARLKEIKKLVDSDCYFVINKARQYGKTTTLRALYRYLQDDYYVILMDFQTFGNADFQTEESFSAAFAHTFSELLEYNNLSRSNDLEKALKCLSEESEKLTLRTLFKTLKHICNVASKPIVLMIDEVDSASENTVFIDFLAQLRSMYLTRDIQPAFKAVILAGVYDVKNLKLKIRPGEEHKYNSPWNIATDFNIDMSFSKPEISQMLKEYETDHNTGMDVDAMAALISDYTSGYPFLVSRLCQLLDWKYEEKVAVREQENVWTEQGFNDAIRLLLTERNTLFESLSEKLENYPELNSMLQEILFSGKMIIYNYYEPSINIATMFGFVKNQNGMLAVANRIFETWLYNLYLSSSKLQKSPVYSASTMEKNQFIVGGRLNMRLVLERFVVHFHDLYGDSQESFVEDEGRKYFLLYLRPIINGTGNYYIESRTRNQKRTDVIVDYRGEQFIIEMKIWRGKEYNERGEKQLVEYLDAYHTSTGYLLSFNFNKNKETGVHEIILGDKKIIEAVV